jgi:circadian clock protein KaiB
MKVKTQRSKRPVVAVAKAGTGRRKVAKRPGKKYKLSLYVTGATGRSTTAVANLKSLCDKYLPENYELEIVDIYQKPEMVKEKNIIAAPTLIKTFPLPLRKFIGDMSNTSHLLAGLEVKDA